MVDLLINITGIALLSAWFGMWIESVKWTNNAHQYGRIEHRGKLYKVVLLGDRESEEAAADLFIDNIAEE